MTEAEVLVKLEEFDSRLLIWYKEGRREGFTHRRLMEILLEEIKDSISERS